MPSYRRRVIGFYTRGRGKGHKHIPITAPTRKRKIRYKLKVISPPVQKTKVGESLIRISLDSVLNQAPIFRELHTAYVLADALYNNWSLIQKVYNTAEKEGLTGIARIFGDEAVHPALSSTQTNIVWRVVKDFIPTNFHEKILELLSNVFDEITEREIRYVENFL
jgi:hypothetical protein